MEVGTKEYMKIHSWLNYHHGKASKCTSENCTGESNSYEWALKKGFEHCKDITQYKELCASCHRKYDEINIGSIHTDKHRKNMSKSKGGYSKHLGIGFCNTHKKWRVRDKGKFLGYFDTEIEAIKKLKQ